MKHKINHPQEIERVFDQLQLRDSELKDLFQMMGYACPAEPAGFIYTFPLSQNTTPVRTKGIAHAELEADT